MSVFMSLATMVLRPIACCVTDKLVGPTVNAATEFLSDRFTKHSDKLLTALRDSNARAWKALEIALAGDSWTDWAAQKLAARDDRELRAQVSQFLKSIPLAELTGKTQFRQRCLQELQAAKNKGLLSPESVDPKALAQQVGPFATFSSPEKVIQAEWQAIDALALKVIEKGYRHLGDFLRMRPANGQPPFLVAAARYFFRRRVELDQELFQGLAFAHLEKLSQAQEAGFDAIRKAQDTIYSLTQDTNRRVQDLQAQVGQLVVQLQMQSREIRPKDSLSINDEGLRKIVKGLVVQYRTLPADKRSRLPALLSDIGKLEIAVGDFKSAQQDFEHVAAAAADKKSKAEAHYNAYRAALERRNFTEALTQLKQAVALDEERFAPFPVSQYEPERILGAGGFGVAFLCQQFSGSKVAVKSIMLDGLQRDVTEIFREATALEQVQHDSIIRLRTCGCADKAKTRPFLVMDYFDGVSLDEHVRTQGAMEPDDMLDAMKQVADGLQAAHEQNLLHQDVKPANILVRKDGDDWQVKLIDFGLAKSHIVDSSAPTNPAVHDPTLVSVSMAGTISYAAPEQMGRLPGVKVGKHSDVYAFGKTCYYALLKTPEPDDIEKRKIEPKALRNFLEECTARTLDNRFADFAEVLKRLKSARSAVGRKQKRDAKTEETLQRVATPTPVTGDKVPTTCSNCKRQLMIPRQYVGRLVKCPLCSTPFRG